MRRFLLIPALFAFFSFFIAAEEPESYNAIVQLLSMSKPGGPEIIDDEVLFTYTSSCRRAGVSFAHEGFSKVHWLRRLMKPQDLLNAPIPPGKKVPDPYIDSGILFYIHPIPEDITELEYRMVIDGLWTIDPANPVFRRNNSSGLEYSVLQLPVKQHKPDVLKGSPGTLSFSFKAAPGERITVAGNFNGWDPFMYELQEVAAGNYYFSLSLPPGKYQYIFFNRGERYLDPYNPNRSYSREGRAVSEVVLQ